MKMGFSASKHPITLLALPLKGEEYLLGEISITQIISCIFHRDLHNYMDAPLEAFRTSAFFIMHGVLCTLYTNFSCKMFINIDFRLTAVDDIDTLTTI